VLSKQIEGRITELTADQRTELIEWGAESMDKFQDEFEPRVVNIEPSGS
jgi:hypothetical protein